MDKVENEARDSWERSGVPIFDILEKESDRGAVLVGTAYLENLLEKQLKYHFDPDSKKTKIVDELFKFESALGTFSSKIKICYCLNLITKDMYSDFEIIRKIRNLCAHSANKIFFGSKEIVSLTVNLKGWEKSLNNDNDERKKITKEILKTKNGSEEFLQFREKTRFLLTLSFWLGYLIAIVEKIDTILELKIENISLKEELANIIKRSIELGLTIPDDVMKSAKKYKLI